MPSIDRVTVVPYKPEDMYTLVNDVESYPEFLPWCSAVTVVEQQEESLTATLFLTLGAIKQSFTTKNTMQYGARIDMHLVDGPFQYLHGYWLFSPEDEGRSCRVQLHINYEFTNVLMKYTLGGIFYKVLDAMMSAFMCRAKQVYL